MNSPIGTPSHYVESKKKTDPRAPTITPYKEEFNGVVSIFEQQKPNKVTRAVDPFESVIGESPPVSFFKIYDYRDKTPQIDSIVEYTTDLIVGTDMNINTDEEEDKDGKIKEILEDFSSEIGLFEKTRSYVDDTLTGGTSLIVRVFKAGKLENLEQFDMISLKRVKRDVYGNVIDYMIDSGNGGEVSIKKESGISNLNQVFVPLRFRPRGRDFFGRSLYHGLAVERNVGNRTTRPIIEALWSLDDVVIGTLENFAYPREYHIFDGINQDDMELEAQKFKESKPGDVMFINRMHEIDRREPTQAKFDAFITHLSDIVQTGSGFPLEILLGDFTSKASSQTTDSLLMRRIKSFQQHLVKVVKTEILETLLKFNYNMDDETIKRLNISVEFETNTPMEYTPDQVLSRFTSGAWTVEELRNYDKNNGLDLFDDDKIKKMIKDKEEMQKKEFEAGINDKKDSKDKDKAMKEALRATNLALLKETTEAQNGN
ncbi:portal protein [Nitrososphaeria virus YSH_462411]|uniref:Portal protein n=1 Tax=Nitrososphaeria virus YSH_462411 TaxID=3071321 RepID=A0A976YDU2_9CAUD|nr:portal protein [Yangshan Harbor Nitrososphaeria virus]UVF62288.1 portal protein [Nitrososphaeria virus YSH_462411]